MVIPKTAPETIVQIPFDVLYELMVKAARWDAFEAQKNEEKTNGEED